MHDSRSSASAVSSGHLPICAQRHILDAVEEQANTLLAYTFEQYKSLDEDAPLGVVEGHPLTPSYQPTSAGSAAPALAPAVQLYALLHDILAAKVQDALRAHLQVTTGECSVH